MALADQHGTSIRATAARFLESALEDPESERPRTDGPLVDAVRAELEDVTAPGAVMYREFALHLARSIERREPGHLSAARQPSGAVKDARAAQEHANNPDPYSLAALSGGGGLAGQLGL
ncbi:hypothetical protein [Streptomyces sp. enrichment culture]|uniref:hypothetical protein n=1 Tax=Streptomyces sp. enrichment culture TaxID=1795815 RepID=UPI003F579DBA